MMIIWCLVPEIWSATDRIYCHLGLFFALLPHLQPGKSKFQKKKMKKTLEISSFYTSVPKIMIKSDAVPEIWHMMDCYFSFWAILCPFTPKNKN